MSDVIEKLRKLIIHQKSASEIGNVQEAEAFAGKIQELLTRHKLDMTEIELEQREQNEGIDEEYVSPTDAGWRRTAQRIRWQQILASAVAKTNGCNLLIYARSNSVTFVGRDSDRAAAKILFLYLLELAKDLSERNANDPVILAHERVSCLAKTGRRDSGIMGRWMGEFRQSFCAGFASAVRARLLEKHEQILAAEKAAKGETSTALVHIKRDEEAIAKYVEDKLKGNKEWTNREKWNVKFASASGSAYKLGQQAGSRADLTPNSGRLQA